MTAKKKAVTSPKTADKKDRYIWDVSDSGGLATIDSKIYTSAAEVADAIARYTTDYDMSEDEVVYIYKAVEKWTIKKTIVKEKL